MIAVINQKGGVGKTTTALNVAHALALAGNKVLAIDMDPQGHLTTSFGAPSSVSGVDSVLLDHAGVETVWREVRPGLFLVPAGERLGEMEFAASDGIESGLRLEHALARVRDKFDYVLIDCPPSAGMIGMNALLAAKELLIPVSSDFLAMQGLSRLVGVIQHIEEQLQMRWNKWLVVTRFQSRRRLAHDVRATLVSHFPEQVLRTPINEAVALAESPSYGKTIFDYKKLSGGAQDYLSLATDLVKRRTLKRVPAMV